MWGAHLLRSPPAIREAHFWCLNPEDVQSPALLKAYDSFLCTEERKRVYDVHTETGRKERLLARALVRTTLARYSNGLLNPSSLNFSKNEYGKPKVLWPKTTSLNLHFNLSHTNSLIACGVAADFPLGVDVEDKRRTFGGDLMMLARRRFSSKEATWLESLQSTDEQRHRFLQLWTLKEAYVKALGTGIYAKPLRNFAFHIGGAPREKTALELATQLTAHPEAEIITLDDDDARNWQFLLFEPSPHQYASLCVHNTMQGTKFKFWRTIPLVSDEPLNDGAALAWSDHMEEGAKGDEFTIQGELR